MSWPGPASRASSSWPASRNGSKTRFEVLLQRAQAAGAVRQDINRTDVTALVMGTCMAASQHGCSGSTQRLVGVLCDGFRARAN